MSTAQLPADASDLSPSDYVVIGLATCFVKSEGEVHPVKIAEPIPSAALEAILVGATGDSTGQSTPTSYELACATTLGHLLAGDVPQLPADFPNHTPLCDEFTARAIAATRTYKARPSAQVLIPSGTTRRDFNYSVERKRVLNSERMIRSEDNVKQHEYTHKVL